MSGLEVAAYEKNRTTKLVVERLLQILTEAAIRLGDKAEAICPEIPWRAWRDMGNFIRHAYHRIDDRIIWTAAVVELPTLTQSVRRALGADQIEEDKAP